MADPDVVPPPDVRRHLLTHNHVRGGVVLLLIGVTLIGWRLWQTPAVVSDPPPVEGSLATQLVSRLDPNLATPAQLAVLPGIGPARAADIAATREQSPFTSADDLARVPGIGPAIVNKVRPHVRFDAP